MLKMSYAGSPGPPATISVQFTLKMCVADDNQKFFLPKTSILKVQGHSRSWTL